MSQIAALSALGRRGSAGHRGHTAATWVKLCPPQRGSVSGSPDVLTQALLMSLFKLQAAASHWLGLTACSYKGLYVQEGVNLRAALKP